MTGVDETGRRKLAGAIVRDEIAYQGKTQEWAAERMGMAPSTQHRVIDWEAGVSQLRLRAVEGALGMPRYLLTTATRNASGPSGTMRCHPACAGSSSRGWPACKPAGSNPGVEVVVPAAFATLSIAAHSRDAGEEGRQPHQVSSEPTRR